MTPPSAEQATDPLGRGKTKVENGKSRVASLARGVVETVLGTDLGYRLYLRLRHRAGRPTRLPDAPWHNAVLKSRREWEEALSQVRSLGLPPHPDDPKNWDSLAALDSILRRTDSTARDLDAGAELYSVILPWLYPYGYRRLTGINLAFRRAIRRGFIHYEPGDLTQTRFASNSFDAIFCLSVIEHGVDFEAYLGEMARLLRPGGVLITSTDYWCEPVDTGSQEAYGVPISIFSRQDIERGLELAREHDLYLASPPDLACYERAVQWERYGLAYTFLVFTIEKRSG